MVGKKQISSYFIKDGPGNYLQKTHPTLQHFTIVCTLHRSWVGLNFKLAADIFFIPTVLSARVIF